MSRISRLSHVLVLGWAILLPLRAAAETPPEEVVDLFDQGVRLYQSEDWSGARQAWRGIIDRGWEGSDVYYNLGNAALRDGDLGRAVWAYARAHRLNPGDEDIRTNLEYARAHTVDAVPSEGSSWLLDRLVEMSARVPSRRAVAGALVVYWLGALAVALGLVRTRFRRIGTRVGAVATVLLVILLGFATLKRVVAESRVTAVILAAEVEVQSAPGEEGTPLFTLHAGTEVRRDRQLGGWIEVSLGSELKGWVPAETVDSI